MRLTSAWTVVYKIVGFIGFPIAALGLLALFDREIAVADRAFTATNFLGIGVALIWYTTKLKFVTTDGELLYVSGWFREATIPLAEVEYVWNFLGAWPAVINLKSKSRFGKNILFIPPLYFAWSGDHPVVAELRRTVARAQTNNRL